MEKKVREIYSTSIYDNLHPLRAVYFGQNLKPGDYGYFIKKLFHREGNIKDRNIKFDVKKDYTTDTKTFISGENSNYEIHGKGSWKMDGIINTKAVLEVQFGSEAGVFFNAVDCKHNEIKNKYEVGKQIINLYKQEEWDKELVVATDVIKSGSTTIIVSAGTSSSIFLEASGDIETIEDLNDASLKFKIKKSKNIGFSSISKKGWTPLIKVSRITGIIKPKVKPIIGDHMILRKKLPTELDMEEELFFKQVE